MPITRVLTSPRVTQALRAVYAKVRGTRPLAKARVTREIKLPPAKSWADRFWHSLLSFFLIDTVLDVAKSLYSAVAGAAVFGIAKMWPSLTADGVALIADEVTSFNPLATELAAETVKQIAGVDIDRDELRRIAGGPPGRNFVISIGDKFMPVLNGIFDLKAAQDDFMTRTGTVGSLANLSAFFGTNLTFQLRSLTIATISSIFGWSSLRHLEGLHQTINWAFGFGWLSWSVMSQIMEVAVLPGVRRFYNSQVKTHDLTLSQTYQAFLEGRIDRTLFNQILDNEGIRDDIRDLELDMREKDLTESDVDFLFFIGAWGEEEAKAYYRRQGFREERANLKVFIMKEKIFRQLRKRLIDLNAKLFRDCVISEQEFRQAVSTFGQTAEETDLLVQEVLLERRQRRFLSVSQLFKAVDSGLITLEDAKFELQCQGFTEADALITTILELERRLPKETEDCFDKLKDKAIIDFLKLLASGIGLPGGITAPGIVKFLQCVLQKP